MTTASGMTINVTCTPPSTSWRLADRAQVHPCSAWVARSDVRPCRRSCHQGQVAGNAASFTAGSCLHRPSPRTSPLLGVVSAVAVGCNRRLEGSRNPGAGCRSSRNNSEAHTARPVPAGPAMSSCKDFDEAMEADHGADTRDGGPWRAAWPRESSDPRPVVEGSYAGWLGRPIRPAYEAFPLPWEGFVAVGMRKLGRMSSRLVTATPPGPRPAPPGGPAPLPAPV
jgi:hypothetical protein